MNQLSITTPIDSPYPLGALVASYALHFESICGYDTGRTTLLADASSSIMKDFASLEGIILPARVRRHLWQPVVWGCKRLAAAGIAAIEITNLHRGHLAMRCVYRPVDEDSAPLAGRFIGIQIDVDGGVRWGEFPLSERVRQRAAHAWKLASLIGELGVLDDEG